MNYSIHVKKSFFPDCWKVSLVVPVFENVGEKCFDKKLWPYLSINNLPDDAICNIAIYADDTSLYSKCNQASNLWEQ